MVQWMIYKVGREEIERGIEEMNIGTMKRFYVWCGFFEEEVMNIGNEHRNHEEIAVGRGVWEASMFEDGFLNHHWIQKEVMVGNGVRVALKWKKDM